MLSPDGMTGGAARGDVHTAAAKGISGSGGALPQQEKIQQSFGGYDISNIQAHIDSNAARGTAAMGADAYATGNHVVLGKGGDRLHTQAHEAAHVVQQRAGVSLSGGVGKSGDVYEQHADDVADLVVQGKSAEGLLGTMAGGGGTSGIQMKPDPAGAPPSMSGIVDRAMLVGAGAKEEPTAELQAPEADIRMFLIAEVGARVGTAYTTFVDACNGHIQALKSAAKKDAGIALTIMDVAFSMLAPGCAKGLQAFFDVLPANAPTALYDAAYGIIGNAGAIVGGALAAGKRVAGTEFEHALRRTDAEEFITNLKRGFLKVGQHVRASVLGKTNAELAILCGAFDADVASLEVFEAKIGALLHAFQNEAEPIGERKVRNNDVFSGVATSETGRLMAIDFGEGTPTLVAVTETNVVGEKASFEFASFISPDMASVAIQRANSFQPKGVETHRFGAITVKGLFPPPRLGARGSAARIANSKG